MKKIRINICKDHHIDEIGIEAGAVSSYVASQMSNKRFMSIYTI